MLYIWIMQYFQQSFKWFHRKLFFLKMNWFGLKKKTNYYRGPGSTYNLNIYWLASDDFRVVCVCRNVRNVTFQYSYMRSKPCKWPWLSVISFAMRQNRLTQHPHELSMNAICYSFIPLLSGSTSLPLQPDFGVALLLTKSRTFYRFSCCFIDVLVFKSRQLTLDKSLIILVLWS